MLGRLQCCCLLLACIIAAPMLDACECIERGPVCKWFPNSTEPAFVGRAVEMEPSPDWELSNRIETALRPYVGGTGFVDPRSLEGEAFALYINIYRDFWEKSASPEALNSLSSVTNYGEFMAWQRESGVGDVKRRTRFAVSEVFAGDVGATFDVYTSIGMMCSSDFTVGEEYLVFANGGPGQWTTSACSGTREAGSAQEDLEFLRAYASGGTLGSFAGIAYARGWEPETGYPDNSAASGAEIEVANEDRSWKTRTDQNGRFSIGGLEPGRYSVSGQYQGGPLSPLGPVELVQSVPARGCAFVEFTRPPPSGSISGRVFGPSSEALGGISVGAVPTNGKYSGRQSQTDQNGRFEIKELEPGRYLVGVNINGPPGPYQPYASIYYPGVASYDLAGVYQVNDGLETDVGALTLGRRMPVRKILGKVVNADGEPLPEVRVSLMLEGFRYGVSDYRTSADGSFELEGLEETSYAARAQVQNPRDGELVTAEIVVPSEGDAPVTIVLVVR